MKHFAKILFLGAALAASTAVASATTISGGINIGGQDTFTSSAISFNPTTGVVTGVTGNLSSFLFSLANLQSFSFASASGTKVFTTTNTLGDTLSFTISSLLPAVIGTDGTNPTLALSGTGVFKESGAGATLGTFTDTLGAFSLTSSTSASGGTVITGFQIVSSAPLIASTPEPSSLILLGTGLMSAAGMLVRRRKIA